MHFFSQWRRGEIKGQLISIDSDSVPGFQDEFASVSLLRNTVKKVHSYDTQIHAVGGKAEF